MNVAITPAWTTKRFLDWAEIQEDRYEFDGTRPVVMTGGSARHNRIYNNINFALRSRLRGTSCSVFGPDLVLQTIGSAVRYPDVLLTYTRLVASDAIGLLAMHRTNGQDEWAATALTGGDVLKFLELSIAIPVAEFYQDVLFEDDQASR